MKIFLQSIKGGLYLFSSLLSNLTNVVLLSLVYFSVLGITAIIAKVVGKKFLPLKLEKWVTVEQNKEKESYFRQF